MITDYASLKAAVASWINRSDMTDNIPTWIALAEAAMRRELRDDTGRVTITISAESTPIPSYIQELRSIRLLTGLPELGTPLIVTTTEILSDMRAFTADVAGIPKYAAIVGSNLLVVPQPDAAYDADVTYFNALTTLSDTNTTNSVLLANPDMYLYGSLAHAEGFLEHDERIPQWKGAFDEMIEKTNTARQRREYGPSRTRAGLPRVF